MERHGAVATVLCGELLRVVTRHGISHPIPFIAVTGLVRPFGFSGMVYGEVQGHNAVAFVLRREMLCVVASGIIGDAVPNIAVAGRGRPFVVNHFMVNG